jgi:hypothetical protein
MKKVTFARIGVNVDAIVVSVAAHETHQRPEDIR